MEKRVIKVDANCPFVQEMQDEKRTIMVNGSPMPSAYYNLIVSIRDCKLYAVGIKPHRFWKITDVKKYFGVKGSASEISMKLEEIRKALIAE